MSGLLQLSAGAIFASDFRIVGPLSEGGMGAVYVAEQISTGKQRALKIMQPALVTNEKLRQRFAQEARVGSLIESDHVVEVVGAGIDPSTGTPWLAMELLKGETLSQRLARTGPLSTSEVREVFTQLTHALAAAHDASIVHRDLKPENVFLAVPRRQGAPFVVKILDFGIAKIVAEAQTRHTGALGTPLWMAPEQTEVKSVVTPAADVWALGLIAFHLLTGRFYWVGANEDEVSAMQLLREVVMSPLEPASVRAASLGVRATLPEGFDEWFGHCVARAPNERFQHAREAQAALERALGDAPSNVAATMAMPPTLEPRPPTVAAATMPMSPEQASSIPRTTTGAYVEELGPEPPIRSGPPPWLLASLALGALVLIGVGILVLRSTPETPAKRPSSEEAPSAKVEEPSKPALTPIPKPLDEPQPQSDPAAPTPPAAPAKPAAAPAAPADEKIPTSEATTGAASGASNIKDADAVIARNRWRFKACHSKCLASDTSCAGTIKVTVRVGETGQVESASKASSDAPAGVSQCVVSSFMSMKFAEPTGGAATFTVPVVLATKK